MERTWIATRLVIFSPSGEQLAVIERLHATRWRWHLFGPPESDVAATLPQAQDEVEKRLVERAIESLACSRCGQRPSLVGGFCGPCDEQEPCP